MSMNDHICDTAIVVRVKCEQPHNWGPGDEPCSREDIAMRIGEALSHFGLTFEIVSEPEPAFSMELQL